MIEQGEYLIACLKSGKCLDADTSLVDKQNVSNHPRMFLNPNPSITNQSHWWFVEWVDKSDLVAFGSDDDKCCYIKTNFQLDQTCSIDGNTASHTQSWHNKHISPFLWPSYNSHRYMNHKWRLIPTEYNTLTNVFCIENLSSGRFLMGDTEDGVPDMVKWDRSRAPTTKSLLWRFEKAVKSPPDAPLPAAHYTIVCSSNGRTLQMHPAIQNALILQDRAMKLDLSHDCFAYYRGDNEYSFCYSTIHGKELERCAPEDVSNSNDILAPQLVDSTNGSSAYCRWKLIPAFLNSRKFFFVVNVGTELYLSGVSGRNYTPALTASNSDDCEWTFLRVTCSQ